MSRRTKAHLGRGRKIMPWLAIAAVSLLALPLPVFAEGAAAKFFREVLFEWIISPFVLILNYLLLLLVDVAQYNSFASAEIVEKGWVVLRDLSNMFFVLILLIIAISSIVKWQKVNYRQNLRRLILMAILINFSKTIVVFFIDLSQVITLTFITAVKDILQAGVLTALGLDKAINPVAEGGVAGFAGDVFTYVVAALMVVISCIVVAAILMIFLMRIIALWLAIVFSPLAFAASTLPQTEKWYNKWWDIFGANLTVAPALAFMLWLTFAVIAGRGGQPILVGGGTGGTPLVSTDVGGIASSTLVGFLVSIGLLLYSIRLAVQMGAAGASAAQTFSNRMQGYVKGVGKRLAVGKSGAGGALGFARAGVAAAIAHPGDALRGVGRFGVRLADVGTLGLGRLAGKLPVRFGAPPPAGAGKLRRAAAAAWPQFAETGALGSQVSGVAARAGEKYEGVMKGARAKFEEAEGFVPRQIRRAQRVLEVGEKERQRERAVAAGKAMEVEQMTVSQLRAEIQTGSPFFDARKAAASRELMNRGELDKLKFGPSGREMTDEEKTDKSPEELARYQDQVTRGTQLAQRATQYVMQDSGLTPEEKDKLMQRNVRHFDVGAPDTQNTIKTMLIEGKNFAREDMMDRKSVAAIYSMGSQVLSGSEFKKLIDKLPKNSKPYALEGLKDALAGLTLKTEVEIPDANVRAKRNEKAEADREKIRSQMIRLDPDNIEDLSKDFTEVTDAQTGKKQVTFVQTPASNETKAKNVRSLGVKNLSDMSERTLEGVGKYLSAGTIIKADTHEDFTAAKSESLQRGFVLNFNEGDRNMKATFKSVVRNSILGPRFAGMIEDEHDKEAGLPEEEQKFKKAFDYLKKLESEKGSSRQSGRAQDQTETETEESE